MMKLLTKIVLIMIVLTGDSDHNDTVDSHLNFSVPDSYVEI